jgi:hypothetical protein
MSDCKSVCRSRTLYIIHTLYTSLQPDAALQLRPPSTFQQWTLSWNIFNALFQRGRYRLLHPCARLPCRVRSMCRMREVWFGFARSSIYCRHSGLTRHVFSKVAKLFVGRRVDSRRRGRRSQIVVRNADAGRESSNAAASSRFVQFQCTVLTFPTGISRII